MDLEGLSGEIQAQVDSCSLTFIFVFLTLRSGLSLITASDLNLQGRKTLFLNSDSICMLSVDASVRKGCGVLKFLFIVNG